MRIATRLLPIMAAALLSATLSLNAGASERDKKTVVTFDVPVAIPGQVLPPGTYVFTVFDSPGNRSVVQVWSQDQTELLATTEALPAYRLWAPESPIFRLDDRSPNSPSVIREWFYPGETTGYEFVYSPGPPAGPATGYDGSK